MEIIQHSGVVVDVPGTEYGATMDLRHSFSEDFIFGAASSAYQYEGAAQEGGRGPSIWDTFTRREPSKIMGESNGQTAVDSYHQYKDDVGIMKKMGLNAYRFSISWPRILPDGKLSMGVNKEGIKYYNELINELLANDIKPYVTLFHWDLPQALEDDYGGFLSHQILNDFRDYAEVCFWEFGDRVKHWTTFNEPWSFSVFGYADGTFAPGRGSSSTEYLTRALALSRSYHWHRLPSGKGNPGLEPYLVSHNQLLAHAEAVELYKQKFQTCQGGMIGITLNSEWLEPLDDSNDSDVRAALRALDFCLGWFMEPLTTGDYPESMRKLVGSRLPRFSVVESMKVKKSFDFLGLNYYTGEYATDAPPSTDGELNYHTDSQVHPTSTRNGVPIGPPSALGWPCNYPEGLYKLLVHTKKTYNVPLIYITENGFDEANDVKLTLSEARIDEMRIKYHEDHLSYLLRAIYDGINVKAYFVWSLLDNFEWNLGYAIRFGMIYTDYKNGLKRYPKDSAIWFKNFIKKRSLKLLGKRQIIESEEHHSTKRLQN